MDFIKIKNFCSAKDTSDKGQLIQNIQRTLKAQQYENKQPS